MGSKNYKLQHFNPSTLNAAYDAINKKSIITNITVTCSHCPDGTMPYAINVVLSNFVNAGCCQQGALNKAEEFTDLAANINNKTYKCNYGSFYPDYNACRYRCYVYELLGKHRQWLSSDCSTSPQAWNYWYELFVELQITATGIDIWIDIAYTSRSWLTCIFCGSAVVDCDEIDSIEITNDISSCWEEICEYGGNWWHPCGGTGKAILTGLY